MTTQVLPVPGARLAYEVTGDGPAVVLVHGFGLDMRMWDPQAANLAPRSRVLRYDCRGFGASGPFDPATPYTHAGDLLALLDHCGIGQAVLAGLSFGGRIVLQAALAAPDRVLARRLPGARQEVIAAAGHMVNLEQPAVNALLGGFLDRLPPMAATGTEG